jgi:ABC-type transport system substrate-binding protein
MAGRQQASSNGAAWASFDAARRNSTRTERISRRQVVQGAGAAAAYVTLFGTDEQFRVKRQMVGRTTVSSDGMKYTFTLRDGLRWHDGRPVVSEDCVESLKRWGQKDRFGQLLMAHTGKITPLDRKTFPIARAHPSINWIDREAFR